MLLAFAGIVVMLHRDGIFAFQSPYSEGRSLKYDGFTFSEYKGTVGSLEVYIGRDDDPVPDLALKFTSLPNSIYHLPSMTEEEAAALAVSVDTQSYGGIPVNRYQFSDRSSIRFKNGKLRGLVVKGEDVLVSRSLDGTFLELPANLKDVIKIFGDPREYQRGLRKGY